MCGVNVSGRSLAAGEPTFVIAEIGVNHDGSCSRALELVDAAATAAADAVKLQIFSAQALLHPATEFATYQKQSTGAVDPAAMLQVYQLPESDLRKIVDAIVDRHMIPLATPFSLSDVTTIDSLSLPAIKIASPDLVNRPLLMRAAQSGKPLLLSTGAATLDEIDRTVDWLRGWSVSFTLLHCISSYPTPDYEANLCWIAELALRYKVPIGFSDHTMEPFSGAMAVAAGAVIVEKHLTHDRAAPGPDHACSADPEQFAQYVKLIRAAERLRGKPGKRVLDIEHDVRRVSRQSLVLVRNLQPGDCLREEHLTVQRPGTGISAAQSARVLGMQILKPLEAGTLLQWEMLGDAA